MIPSKISSALAGVVNESVSRNSFKKISEWTLYITSEIAALVLEVQERQGLTERLSLMEKTLMKKSIAICSVFSSATKLYPKGKGKDIRRI